MTLRSEMSQRQKKKLEEADVKYTFSRHSNSVHVGKVQTFLLAIHLLFLTQTCLFVYWNVCLWKQIAVLQLEMDNKVNHLTRNYALPHKSELYFSFPKRIRRRARYASQAADNVLECEAVIEKCSQGLPGPRGPPGVEGKRGLIGKTGERGFPGEKGDKGISGEKGSIGLKGTKGKRGMLGFLGYKGETGNPGKIGMPGRTGKKGEMGLRGESGVPGQPGKLGAKGQKGVQGNAGEKGDKGQCIRSTAFISDTESSSLTHDTSYSRAFPAQNSLIFTNTDLHSVEGKKEMQINTFSRESIFPREQKKKKLYTSSASSCTVLALFYTLPFHFLPAFA